MVRPNCIVRCADYLFDKVDQPLTRPDRLAIRSEQLMGLHQRLVVPMQDLACDRHNGTAFSTIFCPSPNLAFCAPPDTGESTSLASTSAFKMATQRIKANMHPDFIKRFDLTGRSALVTDGARGVGLESRTR